MGSDMYYMTPKKFHSTSKSAITQLYLKTLYSWLFVFSVFLQIPRPDGEYQHPGWILVPMYCPQDDPNLENLQDYYLSVGLSNQSMYQDQFR